MFPILCGIKFMKRHVIGFKKLSTKITKENLFLTSSQIPPHYFQKSLPILPIPHLEQTCQRYLRAITPLFTENQIATTKAIVGEFQNGVGKDLQKRLQQYAAENPDKTYFSDPWFDMYINARDPLPLNFNAAMGYSDDPRPGYMDQALRATNFIVSTVKYIATYEENLLPPNVMPAKPNNNNKTFIRYVPVPEKSNAEYTALATGMPICMSQMKNMFRSTRIPRKDRDELKVYPESRHVVVMRQGHFYTLDVIDENGNMYTPSSILASLKQIQQDERPAPSYPLGILSTADRDVWAIVRQQLIEAGNQVQLDLVDSGMFVLVLDDDVYEEDNNNLSRAYLHGDGINRWFDKSYQMIFMKSGQMGFVMEHSWGDGINTVFFGQHVWKDQMENPAVSPETVSTDPLPVQKVDFFIPDDVKSVMDESKTKFHAIINDLDVQNINYDKFGSAFIKSCKLSPDAIAQLSFQNAFFQVNGFTPPTYESCSTAIFRFGRTETIRPATTATKRFCNMVNKTSGVQPSKQDLRQAIEECSKVHGVISAEAAVGQGHDRHMFGFRSLIQREGLPMPDVFLDPSFGQSCYFQLSTSTVGTPVYINRGSFGPVVPDGYGITYGVSKDFIKSTLTSYSKADCTGMRDALVDSFDRIHKVLVS